MLRGGRTETNESYWRFDLSLEIDNNFLNYFSTLSAEILEDFLLLFWVSEGVLLIIYLLIVMSLALGEWPGGSILWQKTEKYCVPCLKQSADETVHGTLQQMIRKFKLFFSFLWVQVGDLMVSSIWLYRWRVPRVSGSWEFFFFKYLFWIQIRPKLHKRKKIISNNQKYYFFRGLSWLNFQKNISMLCILFSVHKSWLMKIDTMVQCVVFFTFGSNCGS